MNNWQKIYSTELVHRANIVATLLQSESMEPVLINKKDSSYHIGNYELYVTSENVLAALKIITDEVSFE